MQRVLFVQHGDYRAAYIRFAGGIPETYRDQIRSVDYVADLALDRFVAVLTLGSENYESELAPNLSAIGMKRQEVEAVGVAALLDRVRPTHLVLRTPNPIFLEATLRRDIRLLPCFADIFTKKGLRTRLRNRAVGRLLHRALGRGQAPCVANHSLNASQSLVDVLGIPARYVVPWDWSRLSMSDVTADETKRGGDFSLFFAGALSEAKGVSDCLEAIAVLQQDGVRLRASFAGSGDVAFWNQRAASLGVANHVRFLGLIPHSEVRAQMARHDCVIVPSRHSYHEGLPNTIYEALASRSVLLISDHPAFAGRLEDGLNALVFKAAQPLALADCIRRAMADAELCAQLSHNAEPAHSALYIGMEWTALIEAFLVGPSENPEWVCCNNLTKINK